MSLDVSDDVIARLQAGEEIGRDEFLEIVADSLPDFDQLIGDLALAQSGGIIAVTINDVPADQPARGKVLRGLFGTTIREETEDKLGRRIAFDSGLELEDLPYFLGVVRGLARRIAQGGVFVVDDTEPSSPDEWEQLLIGGADTGIRRRVLQEFGLVLVFRNCCATGAAKPGAMDSQESQGFNGIGPQLLAQRKTLINC